MQSRKTTHDQEKNNKKQLIETDSKMNQMLELAAIDFKVATINTYENVKENDYSKWKAEKSQLFKGYRNYKRQILGL